MRTNVRNVLKRSLLFAGLLLVLGAGGCQCSDKPDIGPVEGQGQAAVRAVDGLAPGRLVT